MYKKLLLSLAISCPLVAAQPDTCLQKALASLSTRSKKASIVFSSSKLYAEAVHRAQESFHALTDACSESQALAHHAMITAFFKLYDGLNLQTVARHQAAYLQEDIAAFQSTLLNHLAEGDELLSSHIAAHMITINMVMQQILMPQLYKQASLLTRSKDMAKRNVLTMLTAGVGLVTIGGVLYFQVMVKDPITDRMEIMQTTLANYDASSKTINKALTTFAQGFREAQPDSAEMIDALTQGREPLQRIQALCTMLKVQDPAKQRTMQQAHDTQTKARVLSTQLRCSIYELRTGVQTMLATYCHVAQTLAALVKERAQQKDSTLRIAKFTATYKKRKELLKARMSELRSHLNSLEQELLDNITFYDVTMLNERGKNLLTVMHVRRKEKLDMSNSEPSCSDALLANFVIGNVTLQEVMKQDREGRFTSFLESLKSMEKVTENDNTALEKLACFQNMAGVVSKAVAALQRIGGETLIRQKALGKARAGQHSVESVESVEAQ